MLSTGIQAKRILFEQKTVNVCLEVVHMTNQIKRGRNIPDGYTDCGTENPLNRIVRIVLLQTAKNLHTSLVAQQAGAYPGFLSMKRLGVFQLHPLDGMLLHRRVTPQQ